MNSEPPQKKKIVPDFEIFMKYYNFSCMEVYWMWALKK